MIAVRFAQADDADMIARAHVDAWRAAYRGIFSDDYLDATGFAEERLDRWRAWQWTAIEGAQVFVVTSQELVVGFGLVGPDRAGGHDDRAEVWAFYVHPTAWGSGAGPALMARCAEYLRDMGFHDAVLWVLRDNPRARRFYEKTGWRFTGEESTWAGPGDDADQPPQPEVQYHLQL